MLPTYLASDLDDELTLFLRVAGHLRAISAELLENGAVDVTADDFNARVLPAALRAKIARDGLHASADGLAHYAWRMLSAGWAGDFQAEVTAWDSAWGQLRTAYLDHADFLLNSRTVTASGISAPLMSENVPARNAVAAALAAVAAA